MWSQRSILRLLTGSEALHRTPWSNPTPQRRRRRRQRRRIGCNMIIARRGTPRPPLSTYVSCLHLLAKWKAGESRLCVYARAMPKLCATVPRSPDCPSRVGSEVGSPTPLPALSDRASSSYSPASWSPLAPCVVSTTILVGRSRADVAASPSFGVGGIQAYVTSAVPPRQQANRI